MRTQTAITYCLLLILCLSGSAAQCRSWKEVNRPLPPVAADFVQIWGKVRTIRTEELGFGGQRIALVAESSDGEPNAYTGYDVSLLVWNNQIAAVTVHVGYYPRSTYWNGLRGAVTQAGFGDLGAAHEGTFKYERNDPARIAAYQQAVSAALGAQTTVSIPVELQKSVDFLSSPPVGRPEGNVLVGHSQGIIGAVPHGRRAMEALVRAKRVDLLHNVLCGINPAGRVYAAEGLLTLAASGVTISAADQTAIAEIRALPIPIDACDGCIITTHTAAQLLSKFAKRS